uniref:CMRF35-like molecule 7 n=1 Tax=Fundulus heteroclitus TaxID=8078 RepID=A0A3Q2Q9P8_FUNHE
MRTSSFFASRIWVPVLCLLLPIKDTVDSVDLLAPEKVTATHNGSVKVACQYDLQFKRNTKYWCKGPIYDLCGILVKTPKNRPSDRFFIADDMEAGVFTITMTLIRESDEDVYWCVISRSGRNVYKHVKLVVTQAATTPATTISSFLAQQERSLWTALRWIFFLVMLGCLAMTHVVVWRMKAPRNI